MGYFDDIKGDFREVSSLIDRPRDKQQEADRTLFARTNDFVIDTANAAIGVGKGVVDLVAPDSRLSAGIQGLIEEGHTKQSDVRKASRAQLAEDIATAKAAGDTGIGPWLSHQVRNPGEFTAELVGNLAPFMLTAGLGGAAGALSRAADAGKVAARATAGLGAAAGAGQVRGGYFEQIQRTPDAQLMAENPSYAAMRDAGVTEADAKLELGRKITPTLAAGLLAGGGVGLVAGRYGIEQAMAGGRATLPFGIPLPKGPVASRAANVASEGLQEGLEGGVQQLAQNLAVREQRPSQPVMDDVALSAVQEAALGAPGGVVTGRRQVPAAAAPGTRPQPLLPQPGTEPAAVPPAAPPAGADTPLARAAEAGFAADPVAAVTPSVQQAAQAEQDAQRADNQRIAEIGKELAAAEKAQRQAQTEAAAELDTNPVGTETHGTKADTVQPPAETEGAPRETQAVAAAEVTADADQRPADAGPGVGRPVDASVVQPAAADAVSPAPMAQPGKRRGERDALPDTGRGVVRPADGRRVPDDAAGVRPDEGAGAVDAPDWYDPKTDARTFQEWWTQEGGRVWSELTGSDITKATDRALTMADRWGGDVLRNQQKHAQRGEPAPLADSVRRELDAIGAEAKRRGLDLAGVKLGVKKWPASEPRGQPPEAAARVRRDAGAETVAIPPARPTWATLDEAQQFISRQRRGGAHIPARPIALPDGRYSYALKGEAAYADAVAAVQTAEADAAPSPRNERPAPIPAAQRLQESMAATSKRPSSSEKRPEPDRFKMFLRRHGISLKHRTDITGERSGKARKGVPPGLFRASGLGLDELAIRAWEEGYLTQADLDAANDNGGVNKLSEMIERALRGDRILTAEEAVEQAAREYAEAQEDALAAMLETDEDFINELLSEARDDHLRETDEGRVDPGPTGEARTGEEGAGEADARGSQEGDLRGGASPGAAEGFRLESPTAAELQQKAAQQEDAAAEKRQRESAPPAEEFRLTGSARDADVAEAAGQTSLLDQAEKPATNGAKAKLADAGEELGANKRNRLKGLSWDDIKDLNDTLKVKEVTKPNVWPRPNYEQLVADGMDPVRARLLKQVYDRLAPAPKTRKAATDEELRSFIEYAHLARDAVMAWARESGEPRALGNTLLHAVFPELKGGGFRTAGPSVNHRALVLGGNRFVKALQISSSDVRDAQREVAAGWPAKQEAWQKSFDVRQGEMRANDVPNADPTAEVVVRWNVYRKGSGVFLASRNTPKEGFATREEAVEYARELAKRAKPEDQPPDEGGIDLSEVVREGPARREPGENVTAERVMQAFGFRGVNFGNWVNQKERQGHINGLYDALFDLVDVTGLPPYALSLNGMLGVAVGAQGGGRASAHFVPGLNEVNITKTRGAGALAHEWAHALDHFFASLNGTTSARSEKPYMSASAGTDGNVRPEVRQAFAEVIAAMNRRAETQDEMVSRLIDTKAKDRKLLESWIRSLRRDLKDADAAAFDAVAERIKAGDIGEPIPARPRTLERPLRSMVVELGQAYKASAGRNADRVALEQITMAGEFIQRIGDEAAFVRNHKPQSRETTFLTSSRALDKGTRNYWKSPWEMFARAFEAFTVDRLATRDMRSDYLVARSKSVPVSADWKGAYPEGDERAAINDAFERLIGALKTREENGRTVLYSLQSEFAADALAELAANDESFLYPISKSSDLATVLGEIDPTVTYVGDETRPDEKEESGAEQRLMFKSATGENFYVYTDPKRVWVDLSRLEEGTGGSAVYAAVANWAYNTKRVFIGDPAGLSRIALRRRTEHMLSSALKFGTTAHLEPHPDQLAGDPKHGVPALKWSRGDDYANVQSLIETSVANTFDAVPEGEHVRYDFSGRQFVDERTGETVSAEALDREVESAGARTAAVGRRTYARAILLNTLLRGTSATRPGLLAGVLRESRQRLGALREVFYSKTDAAQNPAEVAAATKRVQATTDRITSRWKNAPPIAVLATQADIPEQHRAANGQVV